MVEDSLSDWDKRESGSYPDVFPVSFSHAEFPESCTFMI